MSRQLIWTWIHGNCWQNICKISNFYFILFYGEKLITYLFPELRLIRHHFHPIRILNQCNLILLNPLENINKKKNQRSNFCKQCIPFSKSSNKFELQQICAQIKPYRIFNFRPFQLIFIINYLILRYFYVICKNLKYFIKNLNN